MNLILDKDTIIGFRAGEEKALKKVFNAYYPNLFLFVRKLTSNSEEAEDILMRTFASIFSRSNLFETETNIKAFLYITARNHSLNYLKFKQRDNEKMREFAEHMKDDTFVEYEYSISTEVVESIAQAIESLPEECRKIFKMLYYEEMSPTDVAMFLKISVNTVYTQRRRALQSLRLLLSENALALPWLFHTYVLLQITLDHSSIVAPV